MAMDKKRNTRKSVQIMFSTQPDVKDMLDKQACDASLTRSAYLTRLILQKEFEKQATIKNVTKGDSESR